MVVWKPDWKKPDYGFADHLNTGHPYCLVFRWIQYSGVQYSDGYCINTVGIWNPTLQIWKYSKSWLFEDQISNGAVFEWLGSKYGH